MYDFSIINMSTHELWQDLRIHHRKVSIFYFIYPENTFTWSGKISPESLRSHKSKKYFCPCIALLPRVFRTNLYRFTVGVSIDVIE